jgi:F-type H+/Na+-transporting ATPase subunit alpha
MSDLITKISTDLQKQIETFEPSIGVREVGRVVEAGDGIAKVSGLGDIHAQELVQFEIGVMGIAFNLEKDNVGVIIVGDYSEIDEGMSLYSTGRIASVPVGDALVGRVVNALGQPVDGKGAIKTEKFRDIERIAPGVVARKDVDTPVQTGIIAIDSMTPIGRGQRELIIGDRQTGKTAIAIDTILNQKGKDLLCIYVAIGQKKAGVARTVDILERSGAMDYTIVIVASADESAAHAIYLPLCRLCDGRRIHGDGQRCFSHL